MTNLEKQCKSETFLLEHTSVPTSVLMLKVDYSLFPLFFFLVRSGLVKNRNKNKNKTSMYLCLVVVGFSQTKALPNLPIYFISAQVEYCVKDLTEWNQSTSIQITVFMKSESFGAVFFTPPIFRFLPKSKLNTQFPLVFNVVQFCILSFPLHVTVAVHIH